MEPVLQYRMKGIAIIVKEKMPHKRHFLYTTTIFTIFLGTTITFLTVLPSVHF